MSNKEFLNYYDLEKWLDFFSSEQTKPYFQSLIKVVNDNYISDNLFPEKENLFRALELTEPQNIAVIIIGQDPYHNYYQADGLAFSSKNCKKTPQSLLNIFKEIELEFGYKRTTSDLSD
ncbi:hypothetical protein IKD48_02450 [bacterium]|nr:hypothetical protein [bacterium]MBR2651881.1 hypothetical protein [bacterium]